MTNKEFFLETLKEEVQKFRVAIDALPDDQHGYKVHDRARTAVNLTAQLAVQWKAMSGIINNGTPDFNPHDMDDQSKADMLAKFDGKHRAAAKGRWSYFRRRVGIWRCGYGRRMEG
ncbi:hypothetical protein IPM19_03865 [bacterium]|nr:MAG: hypothetical protein IPM19_03865 [bacterium]